MSDDLGRNNSGERYDGQGRHHTLSSHMQGKGVSFSQLKKDGSLDGSSNRSSVVKANSSPSTPQAESFDLDSESRLPESLLTERTILAVVSPVARQERGSSEDFSPQETPMVHRFSKHCRSCDNCVDGFDRHFQDGCRLYLEVDPSTIDSWKPEPVIKQLKEGAVAAILTDTVIKNLETSKARTSDGFLNKCYPPSLSSL